MGSKYQGTSIVSAFKIGDILFAAEGHYWLLDDVQSPDERTCILRVEAASVVDPEHVIGHWVIFDGVKTYTVSEETFKRDFTLVAPEEVPREDIGPTVEFERLAHGFLIDNSGKNNEQ